MNPGLILGFGGPVAGSKPKRIIEYTSGAGTFTPLSSASWCRVTLVGAGSGGGRCNTTIAGGGGGAGGQTLQAWIKTPAPVTYEVGARGVGATANNTAGTSGGVTRFGSLQADNGKAPGNSTTGANGGGGPSSSLASGAHYPGASGGAGGNGGEGGMPPGYSYPMTGISKLAAAGATNTNPGGGGGGSSFYGTGGAGGAGAAGAAAVGLAGSGYGAGGGGGGAGTTSGNGGNGSGGYILIEEF